METEAPPEATDPALSEKQDDSSPISPVASPVSLPSPEEESTPKKRKIDTSPQPFATTCSSYDVVPYGAALHNSTHVYSIAATRCMRWFFTGGDDGYIRKYDFYASMNGKTMLTQAQRHPFVDSVTKAGVLLSYWENEEINRPATVTQDLYMPPLSTMEYNPDAKLSPVHSIAVHSDALWALGGLENGNINLYSVRHDEGKVQCVLKRHTSAVSAMQLTEDQRGVVTGSWDHQVLEWDLDAGKVARSYKGHSGQISSLSFRPISAPANIQIAAAINGNGKENDINGKASPSSESSFDPLFDDAQTNINANGAEEPAPVQTLETSPDVMLTSSIDGIAMIWDRRVEKESIRKFTAPEKTPPWCMSACWSTDGNKIFVGRRNGTVDEFDFIAGKLNRTLKMPAVSGPVTYITAFPNGRQILCGSYDNIRLWDVSSTSSVPFQIIPGHHGGTISAALIDPTCRYLITSSGSRGWEGTSTDTCLLYEINVVR